MTAPGYFGNPLGLVGYALLGDVVSDNWDGVIPPDRAPNLFPDPVATQGYALATPTGSMQILGTLFVGGLNGGHGQHIYHDSHHLVLFETNVPHPVQDHAFHLDVHDGRGRLFWGDFSGGLPGVFADNLLMNKDGTVEFPNGVDAAIAHVVKVAGSEVATFTGDGLRGLQFEYSDFEAANRTFTNTAFLDLDALTGGGGTLAARSVTVETGPTALVIITAGDVRNTGAAGSQTILGYRVSGDSTIAANDRKGLRTSVAANLIHGMSFIATELGLTPGTNTFELQARVTANTGLLDSPRITVIPMDV